MAKERLQSTLRQMREDWDHRARANARYFVANGRTDWTDEEFFASGRSEIAADILNDLENVCQGRDPASMRVLEIGCGAGRVTRAIAEFFGEVHAVDVSGEMVRLAREAVAGRKNAFVYQNNGMDLSVIPEQPFDFAFSVIVFQHIPSRDVIENYVHEVGRLLRPGGLFKFQTMGQVAPRGIRKLKRALRPPPADTWLGIALSPEEAEQMALRNGFELRFQTGIGTPEYWLWFFKKPQ